MFMSNNVSLSVAVNVDIGGQRRCPPYLVFIPKASTLEKTKERASNNLVNFKTRPARLKQNLAGQEQRPNWILTWQVFF